MADVNTKRAAPIVVRVDDQLKADVDRCAARRGLSRNAFVASGLRRLVDGEDARFDTQGGTNGPTA